MKKEYRRIAVVGTSGSGKTTLARRISRSLGIPHVELDALHWEPGWVEAPFEVLQERVRRALAGDAWVVDGNYSSVRDIVWKRANTIVWLDYPLPLIMRQLLGRTLRRALTRQELWGGNRETLSKAFFSRDSILLWALTTYRRRRKEYPALFAMPEHSHLRVVRLHSRKETHAWVKTLEG